ncbi:hypothetical protein GW17_00041933 [Ensete ventricosum]|nr:hypothetical protein GW17_00041933 [Ensete ventricosum]
MGNDHAGFELGGTPQQEESENEREEVHGNPTSKDMKRELVLELSCPSSYLMSFSFLSLPAWLSLAPRTMRFFFRQPQHESKHIPVRLAFHRRTVSCSYFDPSPIPTHPWLAMINASPSFHGFAASQHLGSRMSKKYRDDCAREKRGRRGISWRLLKSARFSATRFFGLLHSKTSRAVRVVVFSRSRRQIPPGVPSDMTTNPRGSAPPEFADHLSEAIDDCVKFLNSSSRRLS